jgi:5'-3' exoribonuclease 1
MGIPSYFSHIVREYGDIIKKYNKKNMQIDNLYMDSNSIIYDSLFSLLHTYDGDNEKFEKKLIASIIIKIEDYIATIEPRNCLFIAFDGVAPVAKMEQQRNRRYKSFLESEIKKNLDKNYKKTWDRTAITPGTQFMEKLRQIKKHFTKNAKKYNLNKIIVSLPDEKGEGEHKIFEYIRENKSSHHSQTTVIYGLDADLIMLCINHLSISKHIYLYRETPEFIKSINSNLEPNEDYILDIPKMAQILTKKLNGYRTPSTTIEKNKLYDYILICFFLGNDFMPHFPSMNIRTNGINILLAAYENTIGKKKTNLTDGKKIFWSEIKHFLEHISKNEETYLKDEYKKRERLEKRKIPSSTVEEKFKKFQLIPTKKRETEILIDPYTIGWENRYYKYLFDIEPTEEWIQKICINYLEGLEWTMNYYTNECMDWKWFYHYKYPPLLKDLIKYVPYWETSFFEKKIYKSVHPYVQLSYVLPKNSLHLLPKKIQTKLLTDKKEYYNNNCKAQWAFCKYFWECHIDLPHINIDELEAYIENIS